MPDPTVGLVGLKALRRDIARLTDDFKGPLYDAIKIAGKELSEPVAAATRSALPTSDYPESDYHRPGALRGDVRTYATKTGAGVRMGRKAVPYAPWVEFGGTRHDPHESARPFVKAGRYLFPAAEAQASAAAGRYSDALQRALNRTGLWSNETTEPGAIHD